MDSPKEWPHKIVELYDPIRVLGKGGFASVVLAREKKSADNSNSNSNSNSVIKKKVAIKVVGCNDDKIRDYYETTATTTTPTTAGCIISNTGKQQAAALYARREIELLQQLHHSNIVKLFHCWECEREQRDDDEVKGKMRSATTTTVAVLVLEYVKGPTVESLLSYGGALSTTFGRAVIAQLMDAVAFLHYRGVLHRDIKPDNIIISGALSSDDSVWDNDTDIDCSKNTDSSNCYWKQMCFKWKVTLIDFGFARALTPNDEESPSTETCTINSKNATYHNICKGNALYNVEGNGNGNGKKSGGGIFRRRISRGVLNVLDSSTHSGKSVSHKMKRVMSTLGNRNYVAPEIIDKVRPLTQQDKKKEKKKKKNQQHQQQSQSQSMTTETISDFVADYGLLVDSYSMGHTIRYMMTGVQPGFSVDDAIRKQQRAGMYQNVLSLCALKSKKKKKVMGSNSKKKQRRSVRYRSLDDLPGVLYKLISNLTQQSERNRISIRKARRTVPWINDVLLFQETTTDVEKKEETSDDDDDDEEGDSNNNKRLVPSTPPSSSLAHVSEEQLNSLHTICYLPLATSSIDIATNGVGPTTDTATAKTVDAESFDTDDVILNNNNDQHGSSDNIAPNDNTNDLEDGIITF